MKAYDIAHNNETVTEAMIKFINIYNAELRKGNRDGFEIIHGYGAAGDGGKIKKMLLFFIDKNEGKCKISKITQGMTMIMPMEKMPEYISIIDDDILECCSNPKPVKRITGQLYKRTKAFSESDIKKRIEFLNRNGSLKTTYKNGLKCYFK